ncbi:MAG TPA: fumarylacetoacetate hydrolase family protein [Myxococcota bacterium]|jgi:2-keto-4-pentenoate hydratase/2-oxohepta-3-ene-1,7-dioic acid hydratase in catechol pathway
MRLVTFSHQGALRWGRVEGDSVVDLSGAALPKSVLALLEAGDGALAAARSASGPRLALRDVRLHAPVLRPPKILGIGLNYADHARETNQKTPEVPLVFNKQVTATSGPFDAIVRPRVSQHLDYEGELGFVIGRRCRHVPRASARDVIAGFVVVNDVSVRDWQRRTPTMTMGKSFDTHCPFGPALALRDEVPDEGALAISTFVNGERRQHSNTDQLIFDCAALIEHLSTAFTLEPGDLVTTGTPAGVAVAMNPPKWLVPGDVVRVEIEGLGAIENRVVDE